LVGKNSLVVQFYIGFKAISGYLGIKKIDDLMKNTKEFSFNREKNNNVLLKKYLCISFWLYRS
jgi:hypothetical protein